MTALRIAHPLVDEVRDGAVLSRTDATVVALTPLRADLLVAAARLRSRLVLITAAGARLTRAMADALAESGAAWAVERDGHGWYEGRTGVLLPAPEAALAPRGEEVAPEFLRRGPGLTPQVSVALSARLRPDGTTVLGGAVEQLAAATGGAPGGWGPHEPVERPWGRRDLTAFAGAASPDEVRLHVVGWGRRPLAGSVLVRRTDRGVEEVTQLLLGAGPTGEDAAPAIDDALGRIAASGMPLFALVVARDGEPDLTLRPVAQRPATPQTVLIGPPAVRELGLDVPAIARRFEGRAIGRPRLPGLLVPLGGDRGGWVRLAALVEAIGVDRLRRAAGTLSTEVPDAP